MLGYIIFFALLAGTAYFVNKVVRFSDPKFKVIANIFLGLVFVLALLQAFGVGI